MQFFAIGSQIVARFTVFTGAGLEEFTGKEELDTGLEEFEDII